MGYYDNNGLSPADFGAILRGNNGSGWGMDGIGDLIALIIVGGLFGNGGFGGGFGGGNALLPWLLLGGFNGGGLGGAGLVAGNNVLASDFATLQRIMSDGFTGVNQAVGKVADGLCSLGYDQLAQMNGINQNIFQTGAGVQNAIRDIGTQVADCCCKTQSGIERINTAIAMSTGDVKAAIKDCCCEQEKIAMQNRFDMAQYNCQQLQATDKLGDRILGYLANEKAQSLQAENQALRLQLSQNAQNAFFANKIDELKPCAPVPAFPVAPPFYYGGWGNGTWGN